MKTRFKQGEFYDSDLDLVRYASLFSTLLQNDGQLQIRKQQESHQKVKEAAVPTYLRKLERAAAELLNGIKKEHSYKPTTNTQVEIH